MKKRFNPTDKWIYDGLPGDDVVVWVWDGKQISMDSFNRKHQGMGMVVVQDEQGIEHLQPPTGWFHHFHEKVTGEVICWMPIEVPDKPDGGK